MERVKQDSTYQKRFIVNKKNRFFPVDINDIACFMLEDSILYAITFSQEKYFLNNSLDKVEQELDPHKYFRANRNVIVNIEAIDYFENYFKGKLIVRLKSNLPNHIHVSRIKASAFKEWLRY